MHLPVLLHCIAADSLQLLHRCGVCHATHASHVFHAVHTAVPNDVVDIDVVSNERLHVIVHIDDSYESVSLQSEIIQE